MIGFWEQFILGLVPGILGSVLQVLNTQGKISPSVLAILQSIDASLDLVLEPGVPPVTPTSKP